MRVPKKVNLIQNFSSKTVPHKLFTLFDDQKSYDEHTHVVHIIITNTLYTRRTSMYTTVHQKGTLGIIKKKLWKFHKRYEQLIGRVPKKKKKNYTKYFIFIILNDMSKHTLIESPFIYLCVEFFVELKKI